MPLSSIAAPHGTSRVQPGTELPPSSGRKVVPAGPPRALDHAHTLAHDIDAGLASFSIDAPKASAGDFGARLSGLRKDLEQLSAELKAAMEKGQLSAADIEEINDLALKWGTLASRLESVSAGLQEPRKLTESVESQLDDLSRQPEPTGIGVSARRTKLGLLHVEVQRLSTQLAGAEGRGGLEHQRELRDLARKRDQLATRLETLVQQDTGRLDDPGYVLRDEDFHAFLKHKGVTDPGYANELHRLMAKSDAQMTVAIAGSIVTRELDGVKDRVDKARTHASDMHFEISGDKISSAWDKFADYTMARAETHAASDLAKSRQDVERLTRELSAAEKNLLWALPGNRKSAQDAVTQLDAQLKHARDDVAKAQEALQPQRMELTQRQAAAAEEGLPGPMRDSMVPLAVTVDGVQVVAQDLSWLQACKDCPEIRELKAAVHLAQPMALPSQLTAGHYRLLMSEIGKAAIGAADGSEKSLEVFRRRAQEGASLGKKLDLIDDLIRKLAAAEKSPAFDGNPAAKQKAQVLRAALVALRDECRKPAGAIMQFLAFFRFCEANPGAAAEAIRGSVATPA